MEEEIYGENKFISLKLKRMDFIDSKSLL